MTKRARFIVEGYVQGVCFRMYTRDESEKLGLTGWVRNQDDGCVEVLAEGDDAALAQLLKWCRRGPPAAHVSGVSEEYSDATGEFSGFTIRHG